MSRTSNPSIIGAGGDLMMRIRIRQARMKRLLTVAHAGLPDDDPSMEKICRSAAIAFPHVASCVHVETRPVLHRCPVVMISV
jgi:hypothetical protein